MRKEIYDSLFNKTAETMTGEDYKLYKDLLAYRTRKIANFSIIAECLIAPFAINGLLVGLEGSAFTISPWLIAGLLCGILTPFFGWLSSPSFAPWSREIKKFMKKEFTKEDLKLMRKEKIYKQLKLRCKAFEKTDKYKQYRRDERTKSEAGVEENSYFEYEEQISALQQKQNEINKTLENLRQAQKREKSSTEVSEVFTDFEDKDDNEKGL